MKASTHATAAAASATTTTAAASIVEAIVAACTPNGSAYWILYNSRAACVKFQDDNPFVGRNYSIEFYEPPTTFGPWDGFDFNAPLCEWDCVNEWENIGKGDLVGWLRPLVHSVAIYRRFAE